jgi:cytochrome b561
MKPWANTSSRFGTVSIVLHWGMALLILLLIVLGLTMVSLPDAGFDTRKITLILVHKALGLIVLFTVAVRVAWRAGNVLPDLTGGPPMWQQVTARLVHLLLYALMFALPLTGWLMSSAGGYPVSFFGLFDLPDLIPVNEWLFRRLIELHRWLAWSLILLLSLHAGAALDHHLRLRDDTLTRMLP